jgi:hypothetical protein
MCRRRIAYDWATAMVPKVIQVGYGPNRKSKLQAGLEVSSVIPGRARLSETARCCRRIAYVSAALDHAAVHPAIGLGVTDLEPSAWCLSEHP